MSRERVTVVKEFRFEAAHSLPGYDGPCRFLHGHSYVLQIGFEEEIDADTGMVVDFSQIKYEMEPIIGALDHTYLNEVSLSNFPKEMPTAENMVLWLAQEIRERFTWALDVDLVLVRLYETPTSYAEWRAR